MGRLGSRVWIVGPCRAQNEVLSSYLAAETGTPCSVATSLDHLPGAGRRADRTLILKDCPSLPADVILQRLRARLPAGPDCIPALFNVPAGKGIEPQVFPCGIKGFFYEEDDAKTLAKGVAALFTGELWISRKVMSECLLSDWKQGVGGAQAPALTPREVEILHKVAAGVRNEHIATQLCISPHTVKTHVYRVFRKIGAENRLQAALWAAKNL